MPLNTVPSTVSAALRNESRSRSTAEGSHGVVRLDWSHVNVELSAIAQIRSIAETTILGSSMFELLELGPATIQEGYVRLRLSLPGR